jgi:phospholipid/cholesterol/gamma-HCH transport system permease protein
MDTKNNIPDDKKAPKPKLTEKLANTFTEVYNVYRFILRFFKEAFLPPYEFKEFLRQCYHVGYRSLALISLTGFITGIVFTKQSRPSLAEFGATSWLPSLVSIAILRALAPLITALIAAGKVGSSIGAELGSMRVTEQIDAMEVSATTITIPILTMYTALVSLLGGYLNVHVNEDTSFKSFIEQAFEPISFLDFNTSLIKAIIFGFTIGMVGCYQGYNSSKGTEGVGKAANSSVVIGMFLVFIEEIVIVQISSFFRN